VTAGTLAPRRTATTSSARPKPTTPDASARAQAAIALGRGLADAVAAPAELADQTERGLRRLARPEDAEAIHRVAPGIGGIVGVSFFVIERIARSFLAATRRDSVTNLLLACERWFALPMLEARWLAMPVLERLVVRDPERSWQLLRRASREASDWITVDALAHPVGRGVLAEAFRWAELGQLVFAPSSWERRLVGSTIATIPFVDRAAGRRPEIAEQALPLIGSLIGDDRPEVQKALAWALRSLTLVDPAATLHFCERQTEVAVANADGHRAWVVRDALAKLPAEPAGELRARLAGVRKRPNGPSTSDASAIAADFVATRGVPSLGGPHVERIPIGAR
jgi:3-methyladenine DNA glycosylase AlkD